MRRNVIDKINEIEPVAVLHIPKCLKPGKIYISDVDKWAVHLCACGCGFPVWMKIGIGGWWTMKNACGEIIVRPSTASLNMPCGSRYVITHNRIEWLTE